MIPSPIVQRDRTRLVGQRSTITASQSMPSRILLMSPAPGGPTRTTAHPDLPPLFSDGASDWVRPPTIDIVMIGGIG